MLAGLFSQTADPTDTAEKHTVPAALSAAHEIVLILALKTNCDEDNKEEEEGEEGRKELAFQFPRA